MFLVGPLTHPNGQAASHFLLENFPNFLHQNVQTIPQTALKGNQKVKTNLLKEINTHTLSFVETRE